MSGKEKSVELQPELIQNIHWSLARYQVLLSAMELDVFSLIHEGNSTIEKITRPLGSNHRAVRIFLDALVGMGLLGKTRNSYKLTPESKNFLVKGESQYLGQFLLGVAKSHRYWENLSQVIKSGQPLELFSDLQEKVQFFKELVKGIFPVSFSSGIILGKKLGMGRSLQNQKILDVGAGAAPWSLALALADSGARVTAVDFPDILEVAQGYVKKFHAVKQYEMRPGDYHEVPFERQAYDIIILGQICHMEGEAGSRKLIKKCHEALKPGGRILIAEFLTNELKTGPEIPLLFAINMLLFTPQGDVFSAKDFKRWLNLSGFKKVSTLSAQYPVNVVVGIK
jgi:2-polyprenyl-3-methyl-5-hydroxy-6-metoxy-1,4-benzoquinol methylase/predicted transcriptional regulator